LRPLIHKKINNPIVNTADNNNVLTKSRISRIGFRLSSEKPNNEKNPIIKEPIIMIMTSIIARTTIF